jgi:carboxypeptidase Q
MRRFSVSLAAAVLLAAPLCAQTFRTEDPVVRRMWRLGMDSSHTERLAQVLIDSIGPRLTGTAGFASAGDWLERTYREFGVSARRHQYGTWRAWRPGAAHMQLIAPRVQNLEMELLAWSPGTDRNRPVEGDVVVIPPAADAAAATAWLRTVRGKFVLVSAPEAMCRAPAELERWARPATVDSLDARRLAAFQAHAQKLRAYAILDTAGRVRTSIVQRLDSAGAAGVITLQWSNGWGVNKVFASSTNRIPSVDVSCEDYGLLYRLASKNQGPRVRFTADAQTGGEAPMFNIIAELKGRELPNEYVILSAHLDSWHSATGATDNGTGTITMLEAMRILSIAYPNPRRTILVGHWGAEEVGLLGSSAFAEDHPQVIDGLQALFNQDNGTWRADTLEAQGYALAGMNLARWVALVPAEISDHLRVVSPGPQANSGSDHSSFVCRGAPAFRLQAAYPEYRQYTWHTNRDTYDKIVFDDLKNNATLAAMLAYAASEDPVKVPRDKSVLPPVRPNGPPRPWPTCRQAVPRKYQP